MNTYPDQSTSNHSESRNSVTYSLILGTWSLLICLAKIISWRLAIPLEQVLGENELVLFYVLHYGGLLALPLGLAALFLARKDVTQEFKRIANLGLFLGATGTIIGLAWWYEVFIFLLCTEFMYCSYF